MSQWLKSILLWQKTRHQFHGTHTSAQSPLYFSSQGSATLFWPLWALHARGTHTCLTAHTHTHNIKINPFKREKRKENEEWRTRMKRGEAAAVRPPTRGHSLHLLLPQRPE